MKPKWQLLLLQYNEENVLKQLKTLNTRKEAGPGGLIPKVLRICAYQLAPIITKLFNTSIESNIQHLSYGHLL